MVVSAAQAIAFKQTNWNCIKSDPLKAKEIASQVLRTAVEGSDVYCDALAYAGIAESFLGDFEYAAQKLNEAIVYIDEYECLDKIQLIHSRLGVSYCALGRYSAAFDRFAYVDRLARQKGSHLALISVLSNTASLLFEVGQLEQAEQVLSELLGFPLEGLDEHCMAEICLLQSQLLLSSLRFEDAEVGLCQADLIATRHGYHNLILRCIILRGRILRLKGQLDQAVSMLEALINTPDMIQEGHAGMEACLELSKALYSQQKPEKAIALLSDSLTKFGLPSYSTNRIKALEQLAFGYHEIGDFEQEAACLSQIRQLEQSFLGQQTEQMLALRKHAQLKNEERQNKQRLDQENQLLKQSHQRMTLLNEVAHQITMTLNFKELGYRLYSILAKHMDVHFVSLSTLNDSASELVYRFVIDMGESLVVPNTSMNCANSKVAETIIKREPIFVNDAKNFPNIKLIGSDHVKPRSMLFIPLLLEDDILGVFSLQSPKPDRFGEEEIHFMTSISKFIAIAVSNILSHEKVKELNQILLTEKQAMVSAQARIAHMAYHDSLTTLPNRQSLEEVMEKRIRDKCKTFHLVYIDLDGFKAVNDQHGHRIGDKVLIEIARRMKKALRAGDFAARIGGDEFVLVIHSFKKQPDLSVFLQRMLTAIELPIRVFTDSGTNMLRLSASFGVAEYPTHGSNLDELMHNADLAMYQIKHQGKQKAEGCARNKSGS